MLRNSRFCTFPKEKKRNLTEEKQKIGPAQYTPLYSLIKKKIPGWKIGKEIRNKNKINKNPGPGSYYEKKHNKVILGKFSKSQKFSVKNRNIPGPGTYIKKSEISKNLEKKKGFTIVFKKKEEKLEEIPCSTKYNKISFTENNLKKKRGFEISKAKRLENKENSDLGPGCYKERSIFEEKIKGGKFNLEKKLKAKKIGKIGPGAYEVKIDKKAPEWKFSKNFKKDKIENLPGPEKYNPKDFFIKKNFPKFSFPKNRRDLLMKKTKNEEVGPFSYFKEEKNHNLKKGIVFTKNKKFSEIKKKNEFPGPGKYSLKSNLNLTTNSAYFLKSKNFSEKKIFSKIGPGAYEQNSNSKKRPISCKFSKSKKYFLKLKKTPGVGTYNLTTSLTRPNSAFFKFNSEKRQFCKNEKKNFPGPCSYNFKTFFANNKKFSIGKKFSQNIDLKKENPGPGHYDLKLSVNSLKKNVKIGTIFSKQKKFKEQKIDKREFFYNRDKSEKKGIKFTKSLTKYENNKIPGPGKYFLKSFFENNLENKKGNKFSISKKSFSNFKKTPGPGNYEIVKKKKNKLFSFGKHLRFSEKSIKIPGPGEYNEKGIFGKNRKILFNKEKRFFDKNKKNPGPGSYEKISTFNDVPNYIKSQIKYKIKYDY